MENKAPAEIKTHLLLARKNLEHLSTGDIFRAAIKENTPAGKEARSFIDEGELIPDETVIRVVQEKFETTPELVSSKRFCARRISKN